MDKKEIQWITAVERKHTPLFLDFLIAGQQTKRIEEVIGFQLGFENIRRDGDKLMYDKNEIDTANQYLKSKMSVDGMEIFKVYTNKCYASCEKFLQFCSRIANDSIETCSLQKLKLTFSNYAEYASNHATFLQTMLLMQSLLNEQLDKILLKSLRKKGNLTNQLDDVKSILSIPVKITHEVQNAIELIEIGVAIQETIKDYKSIYIGSANDFLSILPIRFPLIWNQIKQYVDKFKWSGRMYYSGKAIGEYDVVLRLQNILTKDCKLELQNIKKRNVARREGKIEALKVLGNSKELKEIINNLSHFLYLRTYRLDIFFICHEYLLTLFSRISQFTNIPMENLPFLRIKEIESLMSVVPNVPKAKIISDRRKVNFSFIVSNIDSIWTSDNDNEMTTDRISDFRIELKGSVANKGYVEGIVKIIRNETDVQKMSKGDILVTTMTMPSLMLGVEKASAIVTDEGGILCHAAIISRELDIPCIIGTENATKILTDGDNVIVDALSGRVIRK